MIRASVGIFAGAALSLALVATQSATGQDSVQARLSSDRLGYIESGTYLAGDRVGFVLDAAGRDYLLRVNGSPEIYVLYADSASLGGRVLKYDSGETAVQVSGWGGITLYTDADPAGLPAVRTGDSVAPTPPAASISDVQNAVQDDAEHFVLVRRLDLAFSPDWSALADDGRARALVLDALENVARGLERFGRTLHGRNALARRVSKVALAIAGRPAVTLNGRTLMVTFDPTRSYEGCASSRAIAQALGMLLSIPQKQS